MSLPTRVFVARLAGLPVFDPLGDQVGRVQDIVVSMSTGAPGTRSTPRVIGLVVEVPGRKRIFVPTTRVTSLDGSQVITTGVVNLRRFEARAGEVLALSGLRERRVSVRLADDEGRTRVEATVEDLAVDIRPKAWTVAKVFVRRVDRGARRGLRLTRRRGETLVVDVTDVAGLDTDPRQHDTAALLAAYQGRAVADLAEAIQELSPERRAEVAAALDDDRLADVLEQLPEDDQVEILVELDAERAADVLEAMEPDDAADLLAELPPEQQERLLARMEPDEAEPLRRLMAYDEHSAGGLMTSEPVILPPEATIAEALAVVRREEVPITLATTVFVCRPPLETPTGRYLGLVHIQKLLREPPQAPIGSVIDKVTPLHPGSTLDRVHRLFAAYDLVAAPVVDGHGGLVGAVTVDDVLDHILPEDWREVPHE
ncbi:MAG: CBS domain-containing protein [Candidatus Phosphoribacter sp.]|nr:CBS domain-containing protein [Actinomycetales bacterium]